MGLSNDGVCAASGRHGCSRSASGGSLCGSERAQGGLCLSKCSNNRAFRRAVMIIQRLYDNVIILAGVKISLAFTARMKNSGFTKSYNFCMTPILSAAKIV